MQGRCEEEPHKENTRQSETQNPENTHIPGNPNIYKQNQMSTRTVQKYNTVNQDNQTQNVQNPLGYDNLDEHFFGTEEPMGI